MKLVAAYASGSVGVLSEAVHSFLDLISASLAFFTIREAGKPADPDHPFGHGKFETLSSLVESLLLIAAAIWIVYEAIHHLRHPTQITHQEFAIATIIFSLVVSYVIYRHNINAATLTDSSAIRVNALHFLSDVVASAGVLLGLLCIKLTGWLIIDPLMAFAVAIYIVLISWKQISAALNELTDSKLPEAELGRINDIISASSGSVIEAHDVRTRKSGATRHVDFHMVVCRDMTVHESHEVCNSMEHKIERVLPNANVRIHVEPCEEAAHKCSTCVFSRQEKRQKETK